MLVLFGDTWIAPGSIACIFLDRNEGEDDPVRIFLKNDDEPIGLPGDQSTVDAYAKMVNDALAPPRSKTSSGSGEFVTLPNGDVAEAV